MEINPMMDNLKIREKFRDSYRNGVLRRCIYLREMLKN